MIAGIDEAGRGALAGPVSIAAVILGPSTNLSLLSDSKALSAPQRLEAYHHILDTCIVIQSVLSHKTIDKHNILQATLMGMKFCIEKLPPKCTLVQIDGNKSPYITHIKIETIVKGDSKIPAISAASIIAKVTRDKIMDACEKKFPQYEFSKHKGYGTEKHYELIFKYGISPIHRKTFNLNKQESLF